MLMVLTVKEERETKEDLHVVGNAGQTGRGAGLGTQSQGPCCGPVCSADCVQADLSRGQVVVQSQAGGRCSEESSSNCDTWLEEVTEGRDRVPDRAGDPPSCRGLSHKENPA